MMPASVERGRVTPQQIGAEVVAALVKAPRTREQVAEYADCDATTAWRWLKQLEASRLVFQRGRLWHWEPFRGEEAWGLKGQA